jgi:hypothetical protein
VRQFRLAHFLFIGVFMKEIVLSGITFLEYDDERIYENKRRIRFWYGVASIIAFICVLSFIFNIFIIMVTIPKNDWNFDWIKILFYCSIINMPIIFRREFRKEQIKRPSMLTDVEIKRMPSWDKQSEEVTEQFPFALSVFQCLAPILLQFIFALMWGWVNYRNSNFFNAVSEYFGYTLLSFIFIYIAIGIGIKNCKLMRKEWETNPPQTVQLRLKTKEIKRKLEENKKKRTECKNLIEQCGIRFFVKYYKQISLLPLRDVNVVENYGSAEREERLSAAKKIIDEGMTEIALNEILSTYSNVLKETETRQIKTMLSELTENQKEQKMDIMEEN